MDDYPQVNAYPNLRVWEIQLLQTLSVEMIKINGYFYLV